MKKLLLAMALTTATISATDETEVHQLKGIGGLTQSCSKNFGIYQPNLIQASQCKDLCNSHQQEFVKVRCNVGWLSSSVECVCKKTPKPQ